jgi:hypothetical protein
MKYRKLRIAWSVGWALAAVLLIALWVRNYLLYGIRGSAFNGEQDFVFGVVGLTAIVAALSWLQWSRQFSLRTLLIATTLVAVVLGLVVWLKHR